MDNCEIHQGEQLTTKNFDLTKARSLSRTRKGSTQTTHKDQFKRHKRINQSTQESNPSSRMRIREDKLCLMCVSQRKRTDAHGLLSTLLRKKRRKQNQRLLANQTSSDPRRTTRRRLDQVDRVVKIARSRARSKLVRRRWRHTARGDRVGHEPRSGKRQPRLIDAARLKRPGTGFDVGVVPRVRPTGCVAHFQSSKRSRLVLRLMHRLWMRRGRKSWGVKRRY